MDTLEKAELTASIRHIGEKKKKNTCNCKALCVSHKRNKNKEKKKDVCNWYALCASRKHNNSSNSLRNF